MSVDISYMLALARNRVEDRCPPTPPRWRVAGDATSDQPQDACLLLFSCYSSWWLSSRLCVMYKSGLGVSAQLVECSSKGGSLAGSE